MICKVILTDTDSGSLLPWEGVDAAAHARKLGHGNPGTSATLTWKNKD